MRITVGIATVNRSVVLLGMLNQLMHQDRKPNRVIICATKPEDIQGVAENFPEVKLLQCDTQSASAQRNKILDAAVLDDVVIFFDDDFYPQNNYIAAVEKYYRNNIKTVVLTGEVLADGVNGPGLTTPQAINILKTVDAPYDTATPQFSGYGCNMAVRMSVVRKYNIRFDENLPLYSWQEDVDFSRRLAKHGTIAKLHTARGVHLGVKIGRSAGVRLGYSQVANPLYLAAKKKGYPLQRALIQVAKNITKNMVRSLKPEAYVDRHGRLRGNLMAINDLCSGKMDPRKVINIK